MKILLTKAQVVFESLSFWYYAAIILVCITTMLVGVPSVCVVVPLMLLEGCTLAFIVGTACQITASLLAMWLSYKNSELEVSEILKEKLNENKGEFQSFAFWARVYYNIPLRTIDRLTPLVHNDEAGFYNSLIAAASAIMIRICIPTLLLKRSIELFTLLEPNPQLGWNKFLVWGTILVFYTLIPKIPELMPCPERVKRVIFELESPSLPSSKDKLMEEVTKEQEKTEIEEQKD